MTSLDDAVATLGNAGYTVRPGLDSNILAEFEDAAVFGFLTAYGTAAELLSRWKNDQDAFIQRHVQSIRSAKEKRANFYAVFITDDAGEPEERRLVTAIEEDFVASRKIVATGVKTRQHLTTALLPILPLQASANIAEADLDRRIEQRLQTHPRLLNALLTSNSADVLIDALVRR